MQWLLRSLLRECLEIQAEAKLGRVKERNAQMYDLEKDFD
jgi:hypothetical protein